MPSAAWYLNRLRRMSPAEILHRLGRQLQTAAESRSSGHGLRTVAPVPDAGNYGLPPVPAVKVSSEPYLQAADAAAVGRGPVLGLPNAEYGPQFGWNRDPRTGTLAPLVFGKQLDYRDEALAGDIKYLWEPNRHLHFPALAQAFLISGDARYLSALGVHIGTWMDQCPYARGPNWTSALETGIRLINWSYTWRLLGGLPAMRTLGAQYGIPVDRWLQSIHEHLHFTSHYYSGFSSANNHLIGEAAGVYIGCLTWPLWPKCAQWRDRARRILIAECHRQNFEDGVNREQATSYQQFVFDFLTLAAIAGEQGGEPFPHDYWQRLECMVEFVAALSSQGGSVPQIGDSDDALVVGLAPDAFVEPFRSMLVAGAWLFDRPEWDRLAQGPVDRARWMMSGVEKGIGSKTARRPHPAAASQLRSFPQGGYHVLRTPPTTHPAIKVVFDTGPLGYLSIAAHGHADALATLLSIDDMEFLVDAGTYAYHTEKRWRDYFRGTRAHNTVCIDGRDQSEPGGNFMWLQHADAQTIGARVDDRGAEVAGRHEGYRRLADPVEHIRRLFLPATGGSLTVTDELRCRGRHLVEVFWHFAEECDVKVSGTVIRATRGERQLELSPSRENIDTVLLFGSEEPLGGWISRHFGEKTPCTTVVWRFQCEGNTTLQSQFRLG